MLYFELTGLFISYTCIMFSMSRVVFAFSAMLFVAAWYNLCGRRWFYRYIFSCSVMLLITDIASCVDSDAYTLWRGRGKELSWCVNAQLCISDALQSKMTHYSITTVKTSPWHKREFTRTHTSTDQVKNESSTPVGHSTVSVAQTFEVLSNMQSAQ